MLALVVLASRISTKITHPWFFIEKLNSVQHQQTSFTSKLLLSQQLLKPLLKSSVFLTWVWQC